ncbi:MAG: hypothetical protein COS76_04500 [Candidatus Portnoybacteria bacterium CG06_land_8_20_14_3_00_39_12]|uniref:Uncharacterized protein n=1 Tax=Candidatus Portnoybacteria bacterium CG06_land_8_20_14_3_00_39_12 TaxID=1974809 RepID=A0A2M7AVQ9_9BACT|nr:MAG: hypothetical protein COS76_04500 [Candidatus Portnoybacteria bacterium CG06_land_8_20_14_3_00_39_12]
MEFLTTWWSIIIEIILSLVVYILIGAFTKGFSEELCGSFDWFAGIIWPIFWSIFFFGCHTILDVQSNQKDQYISGRPWQCPCQA